LYILSLADILRKDFKVAAQNAYIKTSGAFTGEIRSVSGSINRRLLRPYSTITGLQSRSAR
jgi:hypothetical protein